MGKIAIIDDDRFIREMLAENCQLLGHETFMADSLEKGKDLLSHANIDLLFLDVRLPDGNGLDLLRLLHGKRYKPEVIIITGMGEIEGAELAIKYGAWDYLQKPLSRQEIILQVKRALEYHSKQQQEPSHINLKRDLIIGTSPSLCTSLDQVASCANTATTVLLTGETGTGKELFARAIHANSSRALGPFIVVDCASLPEKLIESILFGHVKGAFTGADRNQTGLIEQAGGGTLFLDEVGELPMETQKKFLRVLQERVFRPLGSNKELAANFRLVAATNRDLKQMVAENNFRDDLYYRLNGFNIHLPQLSERRQDIEKLAMHFIFEICREENLPIKGVDPDTLDAMLKYTWPGNIRELKQTLTKAVLTDANAPVLYLIHLPQELRLARAYARVSENMSQSEVTTPTVSSPHCETLPEFKEYRAQYLIEIELRYLLRLMNESGDNISKACRIAGLSRSRLYDLLKKHSIVTKTTSS